MFLSLTKCLLLLSECSAYGRDKILSSAHSNSEKKTCHFHLKLKLCFVSIHFTFFIISRKLFLYLFRCSVFICLMMLPLFNAFATVVVIFV